MHLPPFLKPKDYIGIAATARFITEEQIQAFIQFLDRQGLKWKLADNLTKRWGIFAGTDKERIEATQKLFDDPAIKAIWWARGGYGSSRILHFLDWNNFKRHPKWLIGFSDITMFLMKALDLGCAALHAPMVYKFSCKKIFCYKKTIQYLMEGRLTIRWKTSYARVLTFQGFVIGGNLSILSHLVGQPMNVKGLLKDQIFFIEDTDEYLYHIDRMLWQLYYAGWLGQPKVMLLGDFEPVHDNPDIAFPLTLEKMVTEKIAVPLVDGFPVGHGEQNLPIPLGVKARLEVVEQQATLTY